METGIQAAVALKVISMVRQSVQTEGMSISETTSLAADLRLGRLGRGRLALHLEDAFDIEISDDVVASFQVVADIVRYLSRRYFRDVDVDAPYASCEKVVTPSA